MATCSGDVVLLNCGSLPPLGWLEELALVAHAEERTSCVSPLVNESGPSFETLAGRSNSSAESLESIVRVACAHLPRWTLTPAASPQCVYLRQDVIGLVGLLDPIFPAMHAAIADWVLRAQSLGFVAKRANHIFVPCPTPPSLELKRFGSRTVVHRMSSISGIPTSHRSSNDSDIPWTLISQVTRFASRQPARFPSLWIYATSRPNKSALALMR